MTAQGDTKQVRSVKADFDDGWMVTSHGGSVLIEQALRRLSLRKAAGETLAPRAGGYAADEIAVQVVAGLLCGGKGFQATAPFSQDSELARIFNFNRVVSDSTIYRSMCDLAGLDQRSFSEYYIECGPSLPALDLFGNEKKKRKFRRIVPDAPEEMDGECGERLHDLLTWMAKAVGKGLHVQEMKLAGFFPVFGDGTDLEVRGQGFDAAKKNKDGDHCLRMMSVMAGPLVMALSVLPGNTDEGKALPAVVDKASGAVGELAKRLPVLALLDAAFAEKEVVENLESKKWKYLICANQFSPLLTRLAIEQPEAQWRETGPDARRQWTESAVLLMTHKPEGWAHSTTVAVRRYIKEGEMFYRYSFLYTNLEVEDLPKKRVKKHGFAGALWQLYSTKQGRENNFKTLLTDMGQHHPPSGRLGATQAFAHLAAVAANIHTFLSRRVVPREDRGIRHWRFLRDYVLIAGRLVMQSGRRLLVRLAGGALPSERKRRFLAAQAALAAT